MFFGKAMQDDPSRGRAVGDGSGVYGDIMREAVGQAPRVDPRSFGTGGSRFVGPPAPAGSMPQTTPPGQGAPMPPMPPMQPSTGMLVAGPGGSTKWQPGTGPGTTLPPMTAPNQMPARPPVPTGSMPQTTPGQGAPMPPMQPSTGMLVAGPGGSTKWQPGTGPGTTLPPMTAPNQMPARPPVPAGSMPQTMPTMAASPMPFNNGSRIAQAPQNRPYGELVGSTGSLANRGVRPIGRSANDPMRIAEQMRRRGDPSALLRFGMQQMGQDFAREQNAVNFEQSQAMFGQQQQAINQRDAANFEQGQIMFGEQQNAMNQRDERNFAQQRTLEQERAAAELAAARAARAFGLQPVPVPGTSTPFFTDSRGRIHAGGQPDAPAEPVPPGFVPKGHSGGKTVYGPKDEEQPRFTIREMPGTMEQDPVTKQWSQKPGQMVRIFEDGTYEPIQPRGQAAAPEANPATMTPQQRLEALRKKAGL